MDPAEYETNALVLNNISAVAYAFYEPVSPPPNFYVSGALEFEGALRCDGHLAYVDAARRGLWCFRLQKKDDQPGSSSFDKSLDCQGLNLVLVEEGLFEPASLLKSRGYGASATNTPSSSSSSASNPLDVGLRGIQATSFPGGLNDQEVKMLSGHETRGAATTTVRDAYQHFISAILSALTSTLCIRSGALPLNSRTLLLPQRIQDESGMNIPILASFRVYLTTTGTLVVMLNVSSVKGLHPLSEYAYPPLHGITVLAAPLGVFATCQAIADSEYSSNNSAMPQSPDTQVSRLRPERELGHWRSICAKLLQARNLPSPISGTQKWLSLQRVRRKPTDQSYDGKRTPMITAAPTSLSWPSNLCFCKALSKLSFTDMSSSSPDGSFDPLANAKTWFNSTAEREELLARKKQEREAASAQQTSTNSQPQTGAGLSPIALHRPSNAGVPPGAMYPTPPDGVQNAVGFTPSMDGTISSPGHQPNTTAAVDIDTTVSLPAESFAEPAWETQEPKRERGGSSFDSENLFGDLGPDMFGDNDITDADFSFFDEQPGGMDMALDSVDLSGADRLLDMAQDFNTAPVAEVAPRPPLAPPPSAPPAPVFAKPELKHARSSLNEQPRRNTESDIERQRPVVVKRQASPFNPDTVFKRIKASFDTYTIPQLKSNWNTPQPGSIFDKVDFSPSLSLVNRKYQGNGRFSFSLDRDQELKPIAFEAPPTTGYLRRHGKGRRILKDPPANVGELFARMTTGPGIASQHPSPTKLDDPASDADELSVVSDQDDSSYESDEAPSPDKTGSVRRRRLDDDEQSLATSFRELEYPDAASPHSSVDLPKFSKSDVDLPLARYFADAEPRNSRLMIPDNDFIIAAQLLTEQACTSTLGFATDPTVSLQSKLSRWRELLSITDLALQELRSDLPPWFNDLDDQLFKPFLEVQDVPLLGQPTRMQPRPPGAEQLKPSNPFQIPSPRFEMRRYDTKHIVLPSAVTFWESLGLGPSNGSKDIQAVCIYPEAEGLADDVDGFLNKMQGSYESLRLGSFSRMSASPDFPGGLFPHESETPGQDFNVTGSTLSASLVNGLTKLSDVLSHLSVKEINVVVFFVYSTSIHASPAECCYAFHQLFERYKKLLLSSRKPVENDLVLQLVPRDFLASSTSIVSPSPLDYARLAVETYDRCTMFGGAMPAPAIVLEQTIPRMIDFKLSTTPSASLLHENTCLHIAYAQSVDERWVTAAWTDNRGSLQMTASYCLGRKGKTIATPFVDVVREIWESTHEMISTRKVSWRIIITKCGMMDQSEIDLWSSLAQTESRATVTLTLIAVDTDPSLQLLPPEVKVTNNTAGVFFTTPVSTPQPSMVSPEQSGNPPTPSLRDATSAPTPGGPGDAAAESDAEATLTDVTDHTWGSILAHRLNNSTSLTELSPSIVSGYLVKKGGSRLEDPPTVMEVNIVHNEGNPRAYETLLREMLTYFRGLGTLARARGMTDRETDIRPWHIAAAENGSRALYNLM
ncbi:mediator of RNA polymerase II transcription subunit 13 [Neopestalotiopsis sp. 37M]|nr:mediator of RNA polymerase II transcription subunit 13 [Neopestalotiopsis sp. 37M]